MTVRSGGHDGASAAAVATLDDGVAEGDDAASGGLDGDTPVAGGVRHPLADEIRAALGDGGGVDAAAFAAFVAAQARAGLVHGDRPLCRHLTPIVLDAGRYRALGRAAELVTSALCRVARRAIVDGAYATLLGLDANERALAAMDPGYPQALAVGRLDALATAEGFRFIELNADSPAGIADPLLLTRTLLALPHVEGTLRDRADVRPSAPHVGLLAGLRAVFAGWAARRGRSLSPARIAIVDWTDVDTAAEMDLLCELFAEAGISASFVDPEELAYDDAGGGALRARGVPVDLVYRRVIAQELLARGGLDHPLVQAYRDGAVCVANSFRTKLLNKKAGFAILSDPAHAALFSAEERAAIAKTIPWTRRVRPGPVEWAGRRRDLLELLATERERFVLKPNDEYGGKGVRLGWLTDAAEWETALAEAAAGDGERDLLIAQERTVPETVRLTTFEDGIVDEDVNYDLCPYLFAGRMGGVIARVSRTAISNVSAGGGVAGVLIVGAGDGPARGSGLGRRSIEVNE